MNDILKEAGVTTLLRIPEEWDREAEVVVVGFGGAGAAAAMEAHDAGADVLILEKMAVPGGTTRMSGGGIYCGGTSLQKELGIEDSTEEVYKFFMAAANLDGKLTADPELMKIVAERGSETFEWCRELGITFPTHLWQTPPHFHIPKPGLSMVGNERYPDFASITPPNYRSHWCDGVGHALFEALETAVYKRHIECLNEAPARSLIANSRGEVQGVLAEGREKSLYIKSKKAVILTTGGSGYNKWLVKGLPRSYAAIESPSKQITLSNTGDGIAMALALGADYWANDGACALPMGFLVPYYIPALGLFWQQPRVFVNKYGKRYVNEDWYMAMHSIYLGRQDDMIGWAIIDDKVVTALGKEAIMGSISRGNVVQAESIKDLARAIGVDSEGLEGTISMWNANVATGKDPEWNRDWGLEPLNTAPFYATRMLFVEGNESTGVKINTQAQVVSLTGEPIPKLYAAGRTSGGQYGELYPGCGTSIITCLIFGRIAGKSAATNEFGDFVLPKEKELREVIR